MFKNIIVYRIAKTWTVALDALDSALEKAVFVPCGATQEQSSGFIPPRGQAHGALAESVGGQWMLRWMHEAKMLPASVLVRRVQEKIAQIERETGRKPGKKEQRDLKDEARLDLLPQAFSRQSSLWVWIDPQAHFLVIDASSQTRADAVVTQLTALLPGFAVALLDTQTSPQAAMALWLKDYAPPPGFSIERECELKSADETKSVVRYARHGLDIDEVRAHIQSGKMPTKLAMAWEDRLSFVLTEGLALKKIAFPDPTQESQSDAEQGFDSDVALATGELRALLPDLIEALGGEGRGPESGQ